MIIRAVTFHPFATPTTFLALPLQTLTAPTTFLVIRRRTHAPATTFLAVRQCRRTVCAILLHVLSLVFTRRLPCLIRVGIQPCGCYRDSECQYDLFHYNLL